MCHKETKALISLRTRVHVPLLTPWEASAHTKTSLSTQHKLLLRDGATFQFLTVGTGNTGRKKKKQRTSKRTEIFSCCFWVLVFFLVTGDVQCLCSSPVEKKTLHIPELASTSEAPFILTEFQIIFIPFVAQIWCSQGWLRWKGNITTSDFSLLTVTNRSGVPQRWYENRVLM